MRPLAARALLCAAVLLLSVGRPCEGRPPGAVCQGNKLRAVGREGRDLLHCFAQGAFGCGITATERRARVFARADAKGGCLTTGDSVAAGDRVSAFVSTEISAVGGYPCGGAKAEAAGEKFFAVLKAERADKLRPDAERLAAARARASAKLMAAFAAAESLGNCLQIGDASLESYRVDIWVRDLLARLWPVCGDGVRAFGDEQCDGADSAACPDNCTGSCTCPVCGNGIREPGEQCDGNDAPFCPGQCEAGCTCPGPPICGDGVVTGGEQCEGSVEPCINPDGTCLPPGDPGECQCCYAYCRVSGPGTELPCCPGTVCVPSNPVYWPCVPICSSSSECTAPAICGGSGPHCCRPSGAACGPEACCGFLCNISTLTCP